VSKQTVDRKPASPGKKRLKIVLVTFGVVLGAFAVLYLLTENQHTAPFVYAIF
jgi:hypothetical protein